jgi:2-dehydro-3-deoxyphosphogluconate aldolase / (4S)-4-hydroxy-2-oxoglutarate aldolase
MYLEELVECLDRLGVVPVVQLPDPSMAVPLADALAAGGLPGIELTFRSPGVAEAVRAVRTARPDMLVGVGTVLTTGQADAALDAGAQFIVSPGTNARIVERVLARGGLILPGVATPSEIEANIEQGLRLMKLFPAEQLGGVGFLRAMGGPYRHVSFLPTGGVSAGNLRDYLAEPNVLACAGTWLTKGGVLESGDFGAIEGAARETAAIVRDLRSTRDAAIGSVSASPARGVRS